MFDETIIVRVRQQDKLKAELVVKANPELYENVSHFTRCCLLRELRKHDVA